MEAIMEELRTADDQTAEAMRFLATTFAPDDWIEVRLLPSGSSRWFQLENAAEASSVIQWAVELNARTHEPQNVYVGGNPRDTAGAKGNKSVPLARSVFADFDGGTTVDEALQRIRKYADRDGVRILLPQSFAPIVFD
jgi:hypothetical protein